MIEGHGDDGYRYKNPIRADFSSNVLYGPLDAGLKAHLQEKVATVTHYPEASAQTLQAVAAEAYGIASDQVLVTNGVTEAIYLAAQAFRDRKSATVVLPTFAEYEDACRQYGIRVRFQIWDRLRIDDHVDDHLVFLCNPNNPTGEVVNVKRLQRMLKKNRQTIFVIDESYIEFVLGDYSLLPFLSAYSNVLVLRSFTKSCRIPGLRIGFAIGHRKLISRMQAGKMPWSVNRLAIEAGLYIFNHRPEFIVPIEQLISDTQSWHNELVPGLDLTRYQSSTHFFLMMADSTLGTAAMLKEYLVTRHGLLIRDAANFKGLTPYHFRVACQSSEHNRLLTEALRECSRTGL